MSENTEYNLDFITKTKCDNVKSYHEGKMRTSRDVYYRLLFDEQYEHLRQRIVIGIRDRFRQEPDERPLEAMHRNVSHDLFVPWTRVLFFVVLYCDEKGREKRYVLWDRESRVDKVFNTGK